MEKLYKLKLIALAISTTFITACGDAETNIVEQDPIVVEDEHDHEGDNPVSYTHLTLPTSDLV